MRLKTVPVYGQGNAAQRGYRSLGVESTVSGLIIICSSDHIVGWTCHHARGVLRLSIKQSPVLEHIVYHYVIVLGRDELIVIRSVRSSDVHVVHVHRVSYFSHYTCPVKVN